MFYMLISVLLYTFAVSIPYTDLMILPTCCVAILRYYALRSSARYCARDLALPLSCA